MQMASGPPSAQILYKIASLTTLSTPEVDSIRSIKLRETGISFHGNRLMEFAVTRATRRSFASILTRPSDKIDRFEITQGNRTE